MPGRALHVILLEERHSEVTMRIGVIGIDLHSAAQFPDRRSYIPLLKKRGTEVVASIGVARIPLDCSRRSRWLRSSFLLCE